MRLCGGGTALQARTDPSPIRTPHNIVMSGVVWVPGMPTTLVFFAAPYLVPKKHHPALSLFLPVEEGRKEEGTCPWPLCCC